MIERDFVPISANARTQQRRRHGLAWVGFGAALSTAAFFGYSDMKSNSEQPYCEVPVGGEISSISTARTEIRAAGDDVTSEDVMVITSGPNPRQRTTEEDATYRGSLLVQATDKLVVSNVSPDACRAVGGTALGDEVVARQTDN